MMSGRLKRKEKKKEGEGGGKEKGETAIFSFRASTNFFYSYSDLAGEPCRTSRYMLVFSENL